MEKVKIYIFGEKFLSYYEKMFFLNQLNIVLNHIKSLHSTSQIFLYSGLEEGVSLISAEFFIRNKIPVIGFMNHKNVVNFYKREYRELFERIKPRLYSFTIISKTPTFRINILKLNMILVQTNVCIVVWNGKSKDVQLQYRSVISKWKGSGKIIYEINLSKKSIERLTT